MDLITEGSGSSNVTPVAKGISPFSFIGSDLTTKAVKSTIAVQERGNDCNCSSRVCWCDSIGWKRRKFIPRIGSPPDIFSCNNWKGLDPNKYGSVTKDIEALISQRKSCMVFDYETTPTNAGELLNMENNPSKEDLRAENAALPDVIILEDDVPTEEIHLSAKPPVFIDLEDEDLSSQNILSPLPEIDKRSTVDEILTEDVVLDCVQDQWLRKDNFSNADGSENKKEEGVDLGVEAEDGMEGINGQSDTNHESLTSNIEVNQDSGVNLGMEADNGMEEGTGQTVPSCEGLPKISEISEDEGIDLGLKVEGGMEKGNGNTNTDYGGLPKVSEVNKDKVVDLTVEVDNAMGEDNGQANANYEFLAKIPENDICSVDFGLEARDVTEGDNGQIAANCEGPAKISEFNKEKGVYVGFKDDQVEEENGQFDSCSNDLLKISKINKDKGVYVGMEDVEEVEEDKEDVEAGCDDVADIWNEMTFALECSKDTAVDSLNEEWAIEDPEGCDHSFILEEDIGYVCRICGFVQRAIESIIEYRFSKVKRSGRTYRCESSSQKVLEQTKIPPVGIELASCGYSAIELAVHPRHRKLMKPHQVEGFNFLLSNLVTENPGGCIMAHAPGSGKTFMIISFLQSFMAKYPAARPLIVLPRGIVSTWKKEFQRWQVEDMPLYDFYSSKADSRFQQLEILQRWMSERSILFLGYKQFSSIVCDSDTGKVASECQVVLLTCPSILILDEGHTPRNQDTDILKSLEKVQTPRKVVLSGTLYQNHVVEVFNILNLVRPRFLKLEASKMIKRRILSKVQISSRKSSLKRFSNDEFYDAVEHTLLKDQSFNRKVTVIQDLREMTSKVLHYYKGDSLDELPGLVDFTIFLELSPRQKGEVTVLNKMKNRFKRNSDGSNIYVHPLLKTLSMNSGLKERVDDHKIDLTLEKLDEREGVKTKFYLNLLHLCEASGEKLLVFSQYLLPLKFLERLTVKVMGYSLGKEIFMITGDSDSDLRDFYMEQFNNSSVAKVFFGSIKACGEGISLVGASRIIVLDVHLNPSVTRQAIGRAFRPGQVRKVYTYRLVASGSPEEDDHLTCFRKETISKMWFEWNGCLGEHDFEMETVNVKDSGDLFLETPQLSEDVISVFKR